MSTTACTMRLHATGPWRRHTCHRTRLPIRHRTTLCRSIPAAASTDVNIQPPAAIRAGPDHIGAGLPVTFTNDEIADSAPSADSVNKKRTKHHHQHRHKRPSHRRTRHAATALPPGYKPKSSLQDPAVKIKLLHTAISGFLFLVILIIFLAISPTTPVFSAPFRVVNSLFIIIFAILFVHCCIRLNTLIRAARDASAGSRARMPRPTACSAASTPPLPINSEV